MQAIVPFIKNEYPNQCGIVYCVERKDIVDVAYHLKKGGTSVVFFHVGLDMKTKQAVVPEKWRHAEDRKEGCIEQPYCICGGPPSTFRVSNKTTIYSLHLHYPV